MKARTTRWIFALIMFFALAAVYTPAEAQVVVAVGQPHRHYHHRYYRHHRHRRPYRRY